MAPPNYSQAMSHAPNQGDSMDYEMTPSQQEEVIDMGYEDHQPTTHYDMGYEDHQPTPRHDMGYEDHHPTARRGSMSQAEETQRRASIKAILADNSLPPIEKRRSIQHLMDGRRNSLSNSLHTPSIHSVTYNGSENGSNGNNEITYADMGYGDMGEEFKYTSEIQPVCNENTKRMELSRPPCSHYIRKCSIIAPCCGAPFGCRICHDDCPVLPPKIETRTMRRVHRSSSLPSSFTSMGQTPEDTHHNIDRFAIKLVICRICYTQQSSKSNMCVGCGVQFGEYHCNICNLWMTAEERPYHCADCGFCRVGGSENFKHCHDCGMCIDRNLYESHNCKAGKYKSNCPVCQEYLFSSRSASHEMPCGHAIHWDCFRQLAAHDSRCPVCKKTAETRDRMMPTWTAMAQGVALQPVPPELARVVNITCNDCEIRSDAQAWHFLGVQCMHCQSFNTVVDQIVLSGEEAHEFLEMQAFRQAINDARANGEEAPRRRRVNRRRSAF